jgi:hypothetical protein
MIEDNVLHILNSIYMNDSIWSVEYVDINDIFAQLEKLYFMEYPEYIA